MLLPSPPPGASCCTLAVPGEAAQQAFGDWEAAEHSAAEQVAAEQAAVEQELQRGRRLVQQLLLRRARLQQLRRARPELQLRAHLLPNASAHGARMPTLAPSGAPPAFGVRIDEAFAAAAGASLPPVCTMATVGAAGAWTDGSGDAMGDGGLACGPAMGLLPSYPPTSMLTCTSVSAATRALCHSALRRQVVWGRVWALGVLGRARAQQRGRGPHVGRPFKPWPYEVRKAWRAPGHAPMTTRGASTPRQYPVWCGFDGSSGYSQPSSFWRDPYYSAGFVVGGAVTVLASGANGASGAAAGTPGADVGRGGRTYSAGLLPIPEPNGQGAHHAGSTQLASHVPNCDGSVVGCGQDAGGVLAPMMPTLAPGLTLSQAPNGTAAVPRPAPPGAVPPFVPLLAPPSVGALQLADALFLECGDPEVAAEYAARFVTLLE